MPHRPSSRALIAGAATVWLWAGSGPASADILVETTYLPTSSVVAMPSSTYLPTAYVVPTTSSTTYLPTSAVLTTSEVIVPTSTTYIPTRRSVRYRPRRYVERTTYFPSPAYSMASTSYLAPTSFILPSTTLMPTTYLSTAIVEPTSYVVGSGLVATSASICGDISAPPTLPSPPRSSASKSAGGGNVITSSPSGPAAPPASNERMPSATLDGQSPDEGIPSPVTPPGRVMQTTPPPPVPAGTAAAPNPQLQGPDPNDVSVPGPGKSGAGAQPPASTDPKGIESYQARRPAYSGPEVRNILKGKVVAFESGRPEEGVTVIVTDRNRKFADRPTLTDADGEFKVSLPDGDWSVKVKMPGGSVLPVGRDFVTASNGKVTDTSGRSIREFRIDR